MERKLVQLTSGSAVGTAQETGEDDGCMRSMELGQEVLCVHVCG